MKRMVLLASVSLAACAPQSIEDLPEPALAVVVVEGGGFCSSVYAIDGDGAAWTETSCEGESTGLVRTEGVEVSEADRATLSDLMDTVLALPEDGDCVVGSPSGRRFRFVRTGDAAGEILQCEPGVPPSAQDLAAELEARADP